MMIFLVQNHQLGVRCKQMNIKGFNLQEDKYPSFKIKYMEQFFFSSEDCDQIITKMSPYTCKIDLGQLI